jgi:glutamate dehydrogenase/leucine dehydrogenase
MKELIRQFEEKKPEIIFEWKDSESEAEGWIVINSLRNGAAGGGTRMRKGLDKREVESLAKTMEVKFTVSGPAIGGAKSGINFDPQDSRKADVLKRWYKAVIPLLKNYYGTGGDLNVDEIHEVIPITEEFGLWHPQEGVVNGFYKATEPQKINKIGQLRYGVSKVLEDEKFSPSLTKKYTVADMITGYGVAESVRHYYELSNKNHVGKKAVIQGWGNVASAAAYYLSEMGVKMVGIIDRAGGIIDSSGLSKEKIKQLFLQKEKNALVDKQLISFEEANQQIWEQQAEIFIPAAASRIVTKNQLEKLIQNKLEVISCGANVPFEDKEIFYGPTAEFADQHVAVIPDFVANCGMARVFAYLMQDEVEMTDQAIFGDVSNTIKQALKKINTSSKLYEQLLSHALRQLI